MAAQYTEISLDDMETFLKRAFRALRPKQGVHRNEYYYDLKLSDHVVIRVWTSVQRGTASGAGVGEDAIRVQLMGVQVDRPLMKGKAPIVKRTQGWKNSLQGKIEDLMETYEDKADYWDSRGSGKSAPMERVEEEPSTEAPSIPPPSIPPSSQQPSRGGEPITDKQLKYLNFLLRGTRGRPPQGVLELLDGYGLEMPYETNELAKLTKLQATRLIGMLAPSRYAAENLGEEPYSYDYRGGVF